MATLDEKPAPSPAPVSPPIPVASSYFNPISPFFNAYDRFASWRRDLGLPHPGSVENIGKEVKATHLSTYIFDGARADITKTFSMNPLFQATHSFALGSQTAPPSYNFTAIYATPSVFLQGGVDHEGNVNGRLNRGWSPNNVTKVHAQFSQQVGHNMIQLEQEYQGTDYNVNVKAINPWPTDLTGIYVGSYLQSFTKNLALGFESVFQRPTPDTSESITSYLARYTASDKSWIATTQIQGAGVMTATYWQKLSERVEAAAEIQVVATPTRRDAIATLGAKYDLRAASFKAQLDSTGKVSALLEQRFTPTFSFLVAGEIDHFKNAAKVGVGVMIEGTSLTPEEMGYPPEMH